MGLLEPGRPGPKFRLMHSSEINLFMFLAVGYAACSCSKYQDYTFTKRIILPVEPRSFHVMHLRGAGENEVSAVQDYDPGIQEPVDGMDQMPDGMNDEKQLTSEQLEQIKDQNRC